MRINSRNFGKKSLCDEDAMRTKCKKKKRKVGWQLDGWSRTDSLNGQTKVEYQNYFQIEVCS